MKSYNISGMSCAACSGRVEKAVSSLPGVESCSVNLLTNSMTVSGSVSDSEIISAVEKAGYGASLKGAKTDDKVNNNSQNEDKNRILYRLIPSVVLLVLLMYITMGHLMWGAPLPKVLASNPMAIALLEMIISAVVLVINQAFFINGFKALIHGSPNMDSLVSIGAGASYIYSLSVVFSLAYNPDHHQLHNLYFESAAMILTLITVGKMLEARAKGKTTDAIKSLMDLSPKTATVVRCGKEITIPMSEVLVGDVFLVRPGESVAVDGVVLDGESSINESALTGESIPVDKAKGDKVLAATQNISGFLRCEAKSVGNDTTIASVIKMVEDASATKAPIAKIADRVSGIFVPCVMALSAITFIGWLVAGEGVTFAVSRAISVLVISCPCALGLATPVAIMVGSGVGAKHGVLFKNATALEITGRGKIIALDKTGTITCGSPEVVDVICADGVTRAELLSVAYSLEKQSEHPLAKAVCSYAVGKATIKAVSDFKALFGSGVCATVDGESAFGGSFRFISEKTDVSHIEAEHLRLSSEGKTPLYFVKGNRFLGVIAVADSIREDSAVAIAHMKAMGMRVVMLTGDNRQTAEAIGKMAGVDEVISDLLPDGKAKAVENLLKEGRVIMVGDGINDAPALTKADVGMAIGGGTDIAIDSANVVLMRDSLSDVVDAIRLGRATLRNIHQNLFWAFCYNIVGIPLAAGLFGLTLDPMFGAAAMSLSSFCVVSNALRLNGFKSKYKKTNKSSEIIEKKEEKIMKKTMKIQGMMCPHCEGRVRDTLNALGEVEHAEVSHENDSAVVYLAVECADDVLISAVEGAGYKVISVE